MKQKQLARPEGTESLDDLARRYFAQKERKDMNVEDFGDPERRAFPVKSQEDLDNAARLLGHADDPDAVKRRLKAIAKRKGLALPKAWQGEERADQSDEDGRSADELFDEETGNNTPNGAEDHQELLDDLESTDGPNEDEPRNAPSATIERNEAAHDVSYYAPIIRVNQEKREVVGVATAEVKDAYKTIIGYEASKDAFSRWIGNIREMHDPKKAVGKALEITPDDEHRRIIVRARISKGAEDTWQKVLDGTLTGFSIGGKNGVWSERIIDGEKLPYLSRYDQAELSLVDNPACPASTIEVVRADGLAADVLAPENEVKAIEAKATQEHVERAGARLSKETQDAMHMARDHSMNAAKQTMSTCGCDECVGMMKAVMTNDDPDTADADLNPAAMRRIVADIVRSALTEALRDQVAPTMARVNALLAADASRSNDTQAPDITRRVDQLDEQLAKIYDLVEKIAAQPADGGPVLHGAGPVDKRLATQGSQRGAEDSEIMRRAMELGFAPPSDPNAQIRAAAQLVRPIARQ